MTETATSIDRSEAAAALAAAGAAEQQSSALYGYRFNAPLLILWGLVWMAADLSLWVWPNALVFNWSWPVASTVGMIASALYQWRYTRRHAPTAVAGPRSRAFFWRLMITWALTGAFIAGVFTIFAPLEWRDVHAFWALVIALVYSCHGVWNGWRMAAIGLALGVLTIAAFFLPYGAPYLLAMGAGGGGLLILGGLWLMKA